MSEMAGTIAATDLIRGSFTPATDIYEPEPLQASHLSLPFFQDLFRCFQFLSLRMCKIERPFSR